MSHYHKALSEVIRLYVDCAVSGFVHLLFLVIYLVLCAFALLFRLSILRTCQLHMKMSRITLQNKRFATFFVNKLLNLREAYI